MRLLKSKTLSHIIILNLLKKKYNIESIFWKVKVINYQSWFAKSTSQSRKILRTYDKVVISSSNARKIIKTVFLSLNICLQEHSKESLAD